MLTKLDSNAIPLNEQAQIFAKWLNRSLSFPYEKQGSDRSALMLYRNPPSRDALVFQIEKGQAAMKTKLAPQLAEQRERELFCIGHGEFALKSSVDQEHAYPVSGMEIKQAALIEYLRENPNFTRLLLQQEGMDDFFKMSNEDTQEKAEREAKSLPPPATAPIVMGTRLFYLLCYNDQNNIWLLCHGCNITKGKIDTLKWFQKQPRFGQPFINAIVAAGGLHSGILIDKIFEESPNDYVLHMKKNDIRIPFETTVVQGIGEFVMIWYQQSYAGEYATSKAVYEGIQQETKVALEEVRELRINGQDKKANKKQAYLISILHESTSIYHEVLNQQIVDSASEGESPSGSDKLNSADYEANAVAAAKKRWHNRYCERKIWRLIKKSYPNSSNADVSTSTTVAVSSASTAGDSHRHSSNYFVNELLRKADKLIDLDEMQCDNLLEQVKLLLENKVPPSRKDFEEIFIELAMSPTTRKARQDAQEIEKQKQEINGEKQKTEIERQRADAERREKEFERREKEEARREKEEERREKDVQKARADVLQRQLDELLEKRGEKATQGADTALASGGNTSARQVGFWQGISEAATTSTAAKREYDEMRGAEAARDESAIVQTIKRPVTETSRPVTDTDAAEQGVEESFQPQQ